MKLLALSDTYIPYEFMVSGLASLQDFGVDVEVRRWEHDSLIDLQEANLAIEQGGPDAVSLPDSLVQDCDKFEILIVQFAPVGRRLLDAANSLKAIGVLRGGTENVAVPYATERGISVLNTPGRNARAVAECTIGMILTEIRNLARAHACLRQGDWRREFPNSAAIPELYGKTVGLIGYGAVAQLVAGYLRAFGSHIMAFDPFFRGDAGSTQLVDLPTLLRASDVVSLHARLTDDNYHMLGEKELALMKPSAILVNTARSGLVDEMALVTCLRQHDISGAAIDVFDEEPLAPDHPFVQLDNVTITPHLAGSTIDAFRNSPSLMADHLTRCLRGETDLPIVNGITPQLP
jgi:D-3-phosphoglycerate dehydrogenase